MPADRVPTWSEVLAVAAGVPLAMPAFVWAVSTPLTALAAVAVGALAVRAARAIQRRESPVARRASSVLKRALGRPTES